MCTLRLSGPSPRVRQGECCCIQERRRKAEGRESPSGQPSRRQHPPSPASPYDRRCAASRSAAFKFPIQPSGAPPTVCMRCDAARSRLTEVPLCLPGCWEAPCPQEPPQGRGAIAQSAFLGEAVSMMELPRRYSTPSEGGRFAPICWLVYSPHMSSKLAQHQASAL